MLAASSSCGKTQENNQEETKPVTFSATFDASAGLPFKTLWATGDAIQVYGVKNGTVTGELLYASTVASDGSAKFTSSGKLSSDSEYFYAFIKGTGVKGCDAASSWTVENTAAGTVRSVAVAKCGKGSSKLTFRNMYSFLKFDISDPDVDHVVLTGNNGEAVNYDATVSTSDYSVSASKSPSFEAEKSVNVAVSGSGSWYISLVPGTVFEKGYTLTAYSAAGSVVSKTAYSDKFSVGNGKIYTAGVFQQEVKTFTATFEDTSTPEFKSSWAEGDAIEVCCLKGTEKVVEVIKASDISADGHTAKFVSNGTLPSDAAGYYAMIPGTGTDSYGSESWSTANLDGTAIAKPSVTVASCTDGTSSFIFRNIYSLLGFSIDEASISYVVLQGNNSEVINKNLLVSFSNYAVNGNSSPVFTSTSSVKRNVSGAGTYYFGLYPGLKFSSGYTLIAYNAAGEVVGKSRNTSALTVEKGKVCTAAKFVITKPSVLTKVFDEKAVVASFGVVSDVHINNSNAMPTNKWKSALQQLKAKAAENDADGLDGVLVAGDLIDNPSQTMSVFKSTYESVFSPKAVPLVYTVGNHDVPGYAWHSDMVSASAYIRTQLGSDYFISDLDNTFGAQHECRHCQIGEYDVLAVTPNGDSPITYDASTISWLDNTLKDLTTANPNQYVLIITHPMIYNTVYGSLLGEGTDEWSSSLPHYWATAALTSVLKKYPQAVVFGGHLHFPLNDPRSVWQGAFTVFGCGSVRYMSIENGDYEGMTGETVMGDCNEFSQGNLVQFDASGNMRVLRMDFYHSAVIGEPIVTSYPENDGSNLTKYNFTTRTLANAAPSLSTMSVATSGGTTTVNFAAGKDDEFVHHYVLALKKDGATTATKKILADFYKSAQPSGMKSEWSQSLGSLSNGSYEVSLVAYDSWGAASNILTKTFVISSGDTSLWVTDEAGSKAVSGGSGSVSEGWLSYSDGTVSWTANSTGKPRIASLTLPSGTSYSVTQLSEEDFKGSWTVASSQFGGRGSYFTRNDKASTSVTIGSPLSSESLTCGSQTISNNLGISGLMANMVMDAYVKVDYSANSVKFGLFLDGRTAQKITSGALAGTYGAFLPELSGSSFATGNYEFGRTEIGTPDYDWIWMTVTAGDGVLSAKYNLISQRISATHTYSRDYIAGIEVMNFTASAANDANLVKSTSAKNTESGAYQADYITIYQANYGTSNTGGMTFTKN